MSAKNRIRIRRDHVLEEMVKGLGATVTLVDAPFDPEKGSAYTRWTIEIIDHLDLSPAERHAIYEGNARKLLKLG